MGFSTSPSWEEWGRLRILIPILLSLGVIFGACTWVVACIILLFFVGATNELFLYFGAWYLCLVQAAVIFLVSVFMYWVNRRFVSLNGHTQVGVRRLFRELLRVETILFCWGHVALGTCSYHVARLRDLPHQETRSLLVPIVLSRS